VVGIFEGELAVGDGEILLALLTAALGVYEEEVDYLSGLFVLLHHSSCSNFNASDRSIPLILTTMQTIPLYCCDVKPLKATLA